MSESKPAGSAPKSPKRLPEPEDLRAYYDLMVAEDLLELEVQDKDFYLKLSRRKPGVALAAPVAAVQAALAPSEVTPPLPPAEQDQFHSIASPLAGVFYRSPSPQSEAFVKEGDKVSLGTVLCIVEAMKVMNEIRADRPCTIRKILVQNGKPVTGGQSLFLVDPAS